MWIGEETLVVNLGRTKLRKATYEIVEYSGPRRVRQSASSFLKLGPETKGHPSREGCPLVALLTLRITLFFGSRVPASHRYFI